MAERNSNGGMTIRKTMHSVARYLFLAVLIATLSACAWNLNDTGQVGRLAIRFQPNDAIGAQQLSEFDTITVFVAEASSFRSDSVQLPIFDWQNIEGPLRDLYSEREQFLSDFDPSAHADVSFSAFDIGFQEVTPFPGGSAKTFSLQLDPGSMTGDIVFKDLVVGREYVIWIDALGDEGESPVNYFGFSTTRIRSGAATIVTIGLDSIGPEDPDTRFQNFVSLLYDRYVLPVLPPPPQEDFDSEFEQVSFRFDEYIGTGAASVVIDGNELSAQFDRADVSRFVFEEGGETYTIFEIWLYPFGASPIDFVEVGITILEHGLVLEPSRGAYVFDIEPVGVPASGSIIAVEVDYFDEQTEQDFLYRMLPGPGAFGDAGFGDGIGPNSQGTFFADLISGTFEAFDWFSEESLGTASVSIETLSFNFDEIDLTDLFASEFYIGDIGPGGGYVFYVDEEEQFDWRYLEAAPAGWWFGNVEDPQLQWSSAGNTVLGTERVLGAGNTNTSLLIEDSSMIAAVEAENYGTRSDFGGWFLPSLDELILMFQNLHTEGLGGFTDGGYWSSWDQFGGEAAAGYQFAGTGNEISANKTNSVSVRPARAFGDDFEFIPPEGFP